MYKKKGPFRNRPAILSRHEETAMLLDEAIKEAGIALNEREQFLKWAVTELGTTFRKERMDRRIVIENEIKALGIRLPNGSVKKDYSAAFTLPLEKISGVELLGVDETGLRWELDKEGSRVILSGKPQKSGDFTLRLRYSTLEGEPLSELTIPVAFNPDPREIWRNRPTDLSRISYPKPDSASEYVKVEAGADGKARKDIIAASQRGRSHAHEGKPRDDHFKLFHSPDSDWYVIAVADGAGSARYSRRGSEIACETAVDYCRGRVADNKAFEETISLWQNDPQNSERRMAVTHQVVDILYNGALKAYEAVKTEADNAAGTTIRDFATTLMFAVCKKFDFGWFIFTFWVGDGAMCLFDAEGKTAKLLGTPDEGEFSGQTRFLTMPEIFRDKDLVAKRMRMTIVPDFTALFLMTDGVSDPMFETDRNLNDYSKWELFYETLLKGFPDDEIGGVDLTDDNDDAAQELLGWLDFWSPGNHDDRTIAILR